MINILTDEPQPTPDPDPEPTPNPEPEPNPTPIDPICRPYIYLIELAQNSVTSVRDYLAGNRADWLEFDASQLNDVPSECNLS